MVLLTRRGPNLSSVGSVSQATAIPLRASDRLRFAPNANFNGTATVTYRGWDQSTCVAGVRVDLNAVGLIGGTGPCSTGSATTTATVTPVNDAPGYAHGRSSLRLKPLAANSSFDFVGTTISDLLGNCGADVDTSAVAGIAIIGFGGGGTHFCLGANLARREIAVVFEELYNRMPDITVTEEPAMLLSAFIHGIKRLPVSWTPAP